MKLKHRRQTLGAQWLLAFVFALTSVSVLPFGSFASGATASISTTSDASTDLTHAVRKMNYWLAGDDQAEGWRRFLMLNLLDAQAAKGSQADFATLQRISDRFHSGADGVDHPRFAEVRDAIDRQIQNLQASQSADLFQMVADAQARYQQISPAEIYRQRDSAVSSLEFLKRHYRRTMPSRDRANLFYDLELDQMIEELGNIEVELPPEISVGKMDSMIRDVKAKMDVIEAKLDALPFMPEPEDDTPTPEQDQPADRPDAIDPLQDQGPTEDENQESREELEKQQAEIAEEMRQLRSRRRAIFQQDKPRRDRRTAIRRLLQRFEVNLIKASKEVSDPYFLATAATYEQFVRTYFYGTSDNLQENYLTRIAEVEKQLGRIDGPDARDAAGRLGLTLRWLENANQAPQLVTAIRARYSQPNAMVAISAEFLNQLAAQSIDDNQPVRQNVSGRLVRGRIETTGNVTIDLIPDPNQVHASIHLFGSVSSGTYIQQGKLQVYTAASGNIEARRSVYANVGGLYAGEPKQAANFRADFLGTSSRSGLIERIASKKFDEAREGVEQGAARQAEERLQAEFADQTDGPLADGQKRLAKALKKALDKSNVLPDVYLYSTARHIMAVVRKETISTLAASRPPLDFGVNPHIAVRVHDTMLSNYLDKTFAGKTFTNEELAAQLEEFLGEAPKGITGEDKEGEAAEPFSITFDTVRPIQFEFEDQGIAVVVSGRRFSQGNNKINEGLKILMRFRIKNQNGILKLVRNGDIDFRYPNPDKPGAKVVGFKSFLDSRLNRDVEQADTETELPANLLPIDKVDLLKDSPVAARLRLVQFRSQAGWLYIGWNLAPESGFEPTWIYDTPAIWNEATIDGLDSIYTPGLGE